MAVSIGGIKTISLVDSGADISLIKYDTFAFYCTRTKRNLILSPVGDICGITGDKMNIYGKTQLKIDGIGVATVAVTDNSLKHELILGNDFLRQNKAIINYEDKSIQIKDKNFH